jgi:DNA-binding CsgD family transcriptional regulator
MSTDLTSVQQTIVVPSQLTTGLPAKADRAVSLVELVRIWIFRRSLVVVVLASAISVALLPSRESVRGGALELALILGGAVAGATGFMLLHSATSFTILSRSRFAQAAVVLVASALVSAVFPLHSQLWLSACGLLCLMGLVVPLGRLLVLDLLVLSTNLAAHAISGDVGAVRPVAVIGLWVGIPFWTVLISVGNERVLDHILSLCRQQCVSDRKLLHVSVWIPRSLTGLPVRGMATEASVPRVARLLTTRQKEAALLLISGKHRYEIARRLNITPEEVSRLIARAVKRARARSKEQLAAWVANEWWNTGPAARLTNYEPKVE